MPAKKSKTLEVFGAENCNTFLALAEKTKLWGLKLGTLTKKELMIVVGDIISRYTDITKKYNEVMMENKQVRNLYRDKSKELNELKKRNLGIEQTNTVDSAETITVLQKSKNGSDEGYPTWN